MVCLYYISCFRYTILVGNPQYNESLYILKHRTANSGLFEIDGCGLSPSVGMCSDVPLFVMCRYLIGMHGFGLEETNMFDRAEKQVTKVTAS